MTNPQMCRRVAPSGHGLQEEVAAACVAMRRNTRKRGGRQNWRRKDVARMKHHPCKTLHVLIDDAIRDGAPFEDVILPVRAIELYIRRHYAYGIPELAPAFRAEQVAHCAVDPLQHDAIVTRSPGALQACREGLFRQLDATHAAILSVDRELLRVGVPRKVTSDLPMYAGDGDGARWRFVQ